MIKFSDLVVTGFDAAIRGMRNSWNSHDKSDSPFAFRGEIGPEDLKLMSKLAKLGGSHAKYRRFISVTLDIRAPLYYWKEFDTYKISTVSGSESTMHTLMDRPLTPDDFAHEYVDEDVDARAALSSLINTMNELRDAYLVMKKNGDQEEARRMWYCIVQLLPSSFLQKRTIYLNYETISHMHKDRRHHLLDEWRDGTCKMFIDCLPYAEELIKV